MARRARSRDRAHGQGGARCDAHPFSGCAARDGGEPQGRPGSLHSMSLRPPPGMTSEQRAARRAYLDDYARVTGKVLLCPETMNRRERAATPAPFRDLLVFIAE